MQYVTLTPFELWLASGVGIRRHIEALRKGSRDTFGAKQSWDLHVEGACGECAAAKAIGRYWNGSVNTYHDGGDIGAIQVRTRSEDTYDLIIRDNDPDGALFVLVTGRAPQYCVRGYIRGRDGKRAEWRKTYGGRDAAFFVPQSALQPIERISEHR